MTQMIPVNEPLLTGNELKYVMGCVNAGWISSAGKFITEFEEKWAKYCGMKHAATVCNGTVALELAVEILNFPKDSEIILPSFTIISCAQAITKAGCIPVVVDCEKDTWCMDINQIADAISPRTRAIMPVHIFGHPVDMDPILELAEKLILDYKGYEFLLIHNPHNVDDWDGWRISGHVHNNDTKNYPFSNIFPFLSYLLS